MNTYIADQIAREHTDRLLSDAAAARRTSRARHAARSRRATATTTRPRNTVAGESHTAAEHCRPASQPVANTY
jgi:hypothetical protein